MSIERFDGFYILQCDKCGEETECETFEECLEFKKTEKWKSRKNDKGEWMDVCFDCWKQSRGW